MMNESGLILPTPPVFSPPVNDEYAPLSGGHKELDHQELRPILVDFITNHGDKASVFYRTV